MPKLPVVEVPNPLLAEPTPLARLCRVSGPIQGVKNERVDATPPPVMPVEGVGVVMTVVPVVVPVVIPVAVTPVAVVVTPLMIFRPLLPVSERS